MWVHRGLETLQSYSSRRRGSRFIDRGFQMRFSGVVLSASTLGMLLAVFPIYYFLNQNYQIFSEIALEHSPQLLDHLEREQVWVTTLLFSSFVGLTLFFVLLSLKMTNRIVGPLKVLRNHMRKVSRGFWFISPLHVRENDEFQDLVDAYNYLYESMRAHFRRELDLLKKLHIDPKDREAYAAWTSLMTEKSLQLNLKRELPIPLISALNDGENAGSRGSRHAS